MGAINAYFGMDDMDRYHELVVSVTDFVPREPQKLMTLIHEL